MRVERRKVIMEMRDLEEKLKEFNNNKNDSEIIESIYEKKAILCIDIYKYSKFNIQEQTQLVFVLQTIFIHVVQDLKKYETIFFKEFDFEKCFIDTGDGGFIILDTPLHAILFSCYLSSRIKIYNSKKMMEEEAFNIDTASSSCLKTNLKSCFPIGILATAA
jgi:hypothetical protein